MKKGKLIIFLILLILILFIIFIFLKKELIFKEPSQTLKSEQEIVSVYFGNDLKNPNALDCGAVYSLNRNVEKTSLEIALKELFKGPTTEEKNAGYYSFFSSSTVGILLGAKIIGTTAYLNLTDIRTNLANASASCGSQQFLAEIQETVKREDPNITKIIYAINGNPESFYEWLQIGCSPQDNYCDPAPFK